ncbi:MAG: CHAT domain-containing protein [Thermoguttaceae bacterium]
MAISVAAESQAQERNVPSLGYQAAFTDFYEGEYEDALRIFQNESRGAIKTPQSRWIDSIAYHTMVGECYYQMGRLREALDHYTSAMQLFAAFPGWMLRVQFPPAIRPAGAGARVAIPWGNSTRRSQLGYYPKSMLIGQGQIDQNDVVKHGGVVQQATLMPINVQEIVRATTLAIRRRAELLGPVAEHDKLTQDVLSALARRPGPPNHWSEAWIDVQLGLAYAAAGKDQEASQHLQRGMVAAGQFDHAYTPIALLELGRLALRQGEFDAAGKSFLEATYSAVYYSDLGVLEEAFRLGTLTHILSGRKGMYPPLAAAAGWARTKGYRQLQASLLLNAAENQATLGNTGEAGALVDQARTAIGNRTMGQGAIGARLQYLSALVAFQQGRISQGETALADAMQYMQKGSRWLLHIHLADGLFTSNAATARTAMDLYDTVLRDPQPADWSSDPMEALAVLLTPHPGPIERWFEVALARNEHEKALEIADRLRRHRYFSSQALGGRLQSLRWVLHGPEAVLDRQSILLRQDLLVRYPAYEQLARQSEALRAELRAMPLVPDDNAALTQQRKLIEALGSTSAQQEAILREMAVRREPASLVFPPLRDVKEVQRALPEGHAVLAFLATSRGLYAFLLNREQYTWWRVGSAARLQTEIVTLLREMGQHAGNQELDLKQLSDDEWKNTARRVLDMILEGSQADFSKEFKELIVVPDGMLWYVPFEALQVQVDGRRRPLIARVRVRYVPTVSLVVPWGGGRRQSATTAVVAGKLFPRDDEEVAQAEREKLAAVLPGVQALSGPLAGPSAVYATLFDRLVVLDDLPETEKNPMAFAPVPIDAGKAGNSLSDWLTLPFGAPDEIVLPGFHTAAERSMRGVNAASAGQEMFLTVCALMSTGARTILISRWRPGGRTSYDLVREFAQELPHTSPADAYQRAVYLTAGSRIDMDAEPRVRRAQVDELPPANHPFFWAAYMLVDAGSVPPETEPDPDAAPAADAPAVPAAPPAAP